MALDCMRSTVKDCMRRKVEGETWSAPAHGRALRGGPCRTRTSQSTASRSGWCPARRRTGPGTRPAVPAGAGAAHLGGTTRQKVLACSAGPARGSRALRARRAARRGAPMHSWARPLHRTAKCHAAHHLKHILRTQLCAKPCSWRIHGQRALGVPNQSSAAPCPSSRQRLPPCKNPQRSVRGARSRARGLALNSTLRQCTTRRGPRYTSSGCALEPLRQERSCSGALALFTCARVTSAPALGPESPRRQAVLSLAGDASPYFSNRVAQTGL